MAKETEQTPQQEQHTQQRPCPQDCLKCSLPQQIFCSARMLFDLSRAVQEQQRQQAELARTVAGIREQLQQGAAEGQLSLPFTEQG